jgi:glycosyltransferase involved in cell wall biosynthesis
VYTVHGLSIASPEIPRAKAILYILVERILGHWATSKIIAVSGDEREFIIKLGLAPKNRVAVIKNGIEEQDLKHLREGGTYENILQKPLTFGSIMRFGPQKAPGHLIEAFIRLVEMLPHIPVRLVLVGDGELLPEAKRQVEESGLSENISLLGWRADTRDVLGKLDVFVLSSVYEGLSYAILEAMAAKLPIVSTNVFGMKETISRVPGNITVPIGDPDALADGMKQIATLSEPRSIRQSLRRIGQANHSYVYAHFRQSDTTRCTLKVYQMLCQ